MLAKTKKSVNLIEGNIWKVLLKYTLPLFGCAIVQQLYSFVDLLIVGNYAQNGAYAVNAIGNAMTIVSILMGVALGTNSGCSVVVARHIGEKNNKCVLETVFTSLIAFSILCIAVMCVGFGCANLFLQVLAVDKVYSADCLSYLLIFTGSMPFVFLYNMGCGICSAMGDSKTPFIFLIISSLLNIVLDFVFVCALHLDVAGAAWATFVSQAISSVLTVFVVVKKLRKLEYDKKPKLFSKAEFKELIKASLPVIFQQCFISVGSLFVVKRINMISIDATTGFTTASKIQTICIMATAQMANGLANFASQNLAAEKYDRIKKGTIAIIAYTAAVCAFFVLLFEVLPEALTRFFINADDLTPDALYNSVIYMRIVSPFLFIVTVKMVFDACVRGCGGNVGFAISTFSDLIARIVLVYAMVGSMGFDGVCWAWNISWFIGMAVATFFYFRIKCLRKGKGERNMKEFNFNGNWQCDGNDVTLPHDITISEDRNPDIRNYFLSAGFGGGKHTYTKDFKVPNDWRNKCVYVLFDGVYCNSEVLINGKSVCTHNYGYTPFYADIAPFLNYGKNNEIKVEINTPEDQHSRWYAGSGIYRDVKLIVADKTHILPYGIKITTLSHSPAEISVDIDHTADAEKVEVIIYDGENEVAKSDGAHSKIKIENAKFWSAETPYLYKAKVKLYSNGKVCDEMEEIFGIRTLAWSADEGFLVNGKRTLLRGGCIHADNGIIGMVTNDATEERRVKNIKKTGFNAIRCAHNPASSALLRACDKYGLYVMDEAWDTWYRMKQVNGYSKYFEQTYLEETAAMVKNDYNHPSVVMYSIGNEIPEIGSLKAYNIAMNMLDTIKDIDKTRPVIVCGVMNTARHYIADMPYAEVDEDEFIAESEENKKKDWQHYVYVYTKALSNNPTKQIGAYPQDCIEADEKVTNRLYSKMDMAGYNYYSDKFEVLHSIHPERVLVGTETRGHLIVNNWKFIKEHPYAIGDFIWTLQDHIGEVNVCNLKYGYEKFEDKPFANRQYPWLLNDGGVMDINGHILPLIHRYRMAWGDEKGIFIAAQPPVHNGFAPEYDSYKWTDSIESWSFEGCEGNNTFIDVYSDAYEVEVLVNGKSLGKKKPVEFFAKFPAVYESGTVTAKGYDRAGKLLYANALSSAGNETVLKIKADKSQIKAGTQDFVFLDITVEDGNGVVKCLPERDITIEVSGEGTLQGFGSANPINAEKFNSLTHKTYFGKLSAVIRSGQYTGKCKVKVSAEGLKAEETEIEVI